MEQFWLLNLQFITYILATLAYFSAAWLFWDSYRTKKDNVAITRTVGFIILSITSIAGVFSSTSAIAEILLNVGYLFGISIVVYGIYMEKINPIPKVAGKKTRVVTPAVFLLVPLLNSFVAFVGAYLLWKRFKQGLVKEYKYWLYSWIFLAIGQLFLSLTVFRSSDNVILEQLAKNFGAFWILGTFSLLISAVILAVWIWNYLRFRINPQLFITFVSISVIVSTLSAVIYSTILFSNAESDFLQQLQTNVKTVTYNVNSLKSNALTSANILSKSEIVIKSLETNDLNKLFDSITKYAADTADIDYILVTDISGTILIKTNEFEVVGDKTLSEDPMVKNAVARKESRVSIVEKVDVLANRLEIVATAPIIGKEGSTIGVLQTGFVLDNAYADKLKEQTELEVTIFTKDKRSATTILAADGVSRAENTVEMNTTITDKIFKEKKIYTGTSYVLSMPFYTSYSPLFNVDNDVVGMISVGRPQLLLIESTKEAIYNTFVISMFISLISLVPAILLSQYIHKNYRA